MTHNVTMAFFSYRAGLLGTFSAFAFIAACSASSNQGTADSGDGDGQGDGDGDGDGKGDGDTGDGDIGMLGDGDGDGDNVCEIIQATSEPKPPVILLLLDQSGSMNASEGGTTRWAVATSSLDTIVSSFEAVAEFGLIGFPTHLISSDQDAAQTCNAELKAPPALNNLAAISSSIHSQAPSIGHTPVRAALNLARTELQKPLYAEKNKYVILVTDGLPNCKGIAPSSSATTGFANYEDPSDAVTALTGDGVTTYVVGYAISGLNEWSEGIQHFAETYADNMAAAGGTEAHIPVSSGAELQTVLSDITASIAPCTFELSEAPRGGASYVRVSIDGTDYALDDAWVLEGETTVVLHEDGPACAVLRDGGSHSLTIQVECEPVVVR